MGDPNPIIVATTNSNRMIVESIPKRRASPPQTPRNFLSVLDLTKRDIIILLVWFCVSIILLYDKIYGLFLKLAYSLRYCFSLIFLAVLSLVM